MGAVGLRLWVSVCLMLRSLFLASLWVLTAHLNTSLMLGVVSMVRLRRTSNINVELTVALAITLQADGHIPNSFATDVMLVTSLHAAIDQSVAQDMEAS